MNKFKFGKGSEKEMAGVKSSLTNVCRRALGYGVIDMTVIQGKRTKAEQNRYFRSGQSKVQWPNSKHNVEPLAEAVDIVPYINGKLSWCKEHCLVMAGLMMAAAHEEGIRIRWGGNWDMDGEPVTDQNFNDLCHFEEI